MIQCFFFDTHIRKKKLQNILRPVSEYYDDNCIILHLRRMLNRDNHRTI